jgi:hypothetical protein
LKGHLIIERIKANQVIIGGCCTQSMQYSVYAVLSVNSSPVYGQI